MSTTLSTVAASLNGKIVTNAYEGIGVTATYSNGTYTVTGLVPPSGSQATLTFSSPSGANITELAKTAAGKPIGSPTVVHVIGYDNNYILIGVGTPLNGNYSQYQLLASDTNLRNDARPSLTANAGVAEAVNAAAVGGTATIGTGFAAGDMFTVSYTDTSGVVQTFNYTATAADVADGTGKTIAAALQAEIPGSSVSGNVLTVPAQITNLNAFSSGTSNVSLTSSPDQVVSLSGSLTAGETINVYTNGSTTPAGSYTVKAGDTLTTAAAGLAAAVGGGSYSYAGGYVVLPANTNSAIATTTNIQIAIGGTNLSGLGAGLASVVTVNYVIGGTTFTATYAATASDTTTTIASHLASAINAQNPGASSSGSTLFLPAAATAPSGNQVPLVKAFNEITDLVSTGGTNTPPPCFVAGTRISTARGDVAVENLAVGDAVLTVDGQARAVAWIGHRRVNVAQHPARETVMPVRIRAGAIAENVPARDLLVSPDHAIFLDGGLVQAKQLVNGATIAQEPVASVHYFHVELDQHAILLAENCPAESYLDTGNRAVFDNATGVTMLHPTFLPVDASRDAGACAKLLLAAAEVQPIWKRIADRAIASGHVLPAIAVTYDPALRLVAGGAEILPEQTTDGVVRFALPAGVVSVRLVSNAGFVSDTQPWIADRRRLGVSVTAIEVSSVAIDLGAQDGGWWAIETNGGTEWRWTDGDARIVLPAPAAEGAVLSLRVLGGIAYLTGASAQDDRLVA